MIGPILATALFPLIVSGNLRAIRLKSVTPEEGRYEIPIASLDNQTEGARSLIAELPQWGAGA